MGKVCPCISRRTAAFIAGTWNVITGVTHVTIIAILFFLLDNKILWRAEEEDELKKRQSFGRVLVFYSPPAICTLLTGVLLCLASHHHDRALVEASFLATTGYVCGLGVAIVSLKLYGLTWTLLGPMLGFLVIQIYVFVIAANYRDHLNHHGRLVKASIDRRRLTEQPLDDSELANFHIMQEESCAIEPE